MNSRQLQYAVLLAEARNFSHVAQELDISQPALSKQIISLESELGVRLFDRSSNPLTLTPAGEYFISKAQELLFEEDVLLKTMERFRTGENGKLSIGLSPFRSLYLMPPVVRALKERFPGLQIVLSEYGRGQIHKGFNEGLYDFIITNLPVDDSKLEAIPLEKDTVVLVVPNQLLPLLHQRPAARHGKLPVIDLAACGDLPFALVSKGQEMRQLFDKLCKLAHLEPFVFVEVTGISSAWAMAQAGIGATLLPKQFIQADLSHADVTLFALHQNDYDRQPAIVTRRGQFISEYARYAMQLLTGEAEQH